MTRTYLLSIENLKTYTTLNGSIDDNLIRPLIWKAQETTLQQYLGTDLLRKLESDVDAFVTSSTPIPAGYDTLLQDYVIPALSELVYVRVLQVVRVRVTNNSTQIMESEQGAAATQRDLKPLIDRANNDAEHFLKRMTDYLCDNSASFPEYTSNTFPDMHPTRRNYTGGMNLDEVYPQRVEQYLRDAGYKGV